MCIYIYIYMCVCSGGGRTDVSIRIGGKEGSGEDSRVDVIDPDELVSDEHLTLFRLRDGQVRPVLQDLRPARRLDQDPFHRLGYRRLGRHGSGLAEMVAEEEKSRCRFRLEQQLVGYLG